MLCPFCQSTDTKVNDSRLNVETNQIRRRRECNACHERFTTYESIEILLPRIVKRNDIRESFSEKKLRAGLEHALEKRPISSDDIDIMISEVIQEIQKLGEREIDSPILGEIVMRKLKALDEVAYVRFASVYRRFKDIETFKIEIDKLLKKEA